MLNSKQSVSALLEMNLSPFSRSGKAGSAEDWINPILYWKTGDKSVF